MEGQEQHLHILHSVSEKYSSTLSSSQGNTTAAPNPDSEMRRREVPQSGTGHSFLKSQENLQTLTVTGSHLHQQHWGLGVCTLTGGCNSRGFDSLALTHSPRLTFPHISVVLQEIMHWFSHSLARILFCLVSSQINRQEACFALCTSFQSPWIILLQLLPNCQQKCSQI